jgi:hypothetical protein
MEIEIKKYTHSDRKVWDDFISNSKNGTFLFIRDFMEYHSERFEDFSLLFYLKNKLIAVLPANIKNDILYSHEGLTYGGLVLSSYAKSIHVLKIFEALIALMREQNILKLIYKAIPHIYHRQPSEEDLYALFRFNAKLIGRSISSCIYPTDRIDYSNLRKRGIKKAILNGISIHENNDFTDFWKLLEDNLSQKYSTKPTHTLEEVKYLKSKFSKEILLTEARSNNSILAGCIIFKSKQVSHIQYITSSKEGRQIGALDYLFSQIIPEAYNTGFVFEFGISTENNGEFLNEGLISQKEGFGARGIIYDTYQLDLNTQTLS